MPQNGAGRGQKVVLTDKKWSILRQKRVKNWFHPRQNGVVGLKSVLAEGAKEQQLRRMERNAVDERNCGRKNMIETEKKGTDDKSVMKVAGIFQEW